MKTVHFVGFPSQSPQICTNAGMHGWSAALVHAWLFLHPPVHEERPVNIGFVYAFDSAAFRRLRHARQESMSANASFGYYEVLLHVIAIWVIVMGSLCILWATPVGAHRDSPGRKLAVQPYSIFPRMGGDSLLGCEVDSHDHPGL